MSDIKLPYIKLNEIRVVSDMEEANGLIQRGWVYLGFYARTATPTFDDRPEHSYQIPGVVLGDPSIYQDL